MQNGLNLLGLNLVKAGMDPGHKLVEITTTMITFGMGASTQALFARVGGGIYTTGCRRPALTWSAKSKAGIRKMIRVTPLQLLTMFGDNVGDVAGKGADLYES